MDEWVVISSVNGKPMVFRFAAKYWAVTGEELVFYRDCANGGTENAAAFQDWACVLPGDQFDAKGISEILGLTRSMI